MLCVEVARACCPSAATISRARAMIDAALRKAEQVVFSAPVVRHEQLHSEFEGSVFVLGQDGTVYALDDALTNCVAAKFDAPARAQLAMAEIENETGSFDCRLYYVGTDGGVRALDGSQDPIDRLPG